MAARPPRASRTSIAAPRVTVAAVRQHLAAGIRHDRIAALERRERAQRRRSAREASFKRCCVRSTCRSNARRRSPCAVRQRSRVRVKPMRGARVRDGRREPREPAACASRCAARGRGEARLELVEPLRALAQLHAGVAALQPVREHREVPPLRRDALPRARSAICCSRCAKRLSHSRWSGTASSAACDGVGARKSATKSAIVKSISWPTPTMIGSFRAAIARATTSSLNDQRSSSEPPPRVRISTSQSARRSASASVRAISSAEPGALHGCRVDQHGRQREAAAQRDQHVAQRGARRRGDDADAPRQLRYRALARGVEQAFGREPPLQLLEPAAQHAFARLPRRSRRRADTRRAPRRGSRGRGRGPAGRSRARSRGPASARRNIAQRTCASASFSDQ